MVLVKQQDGDEGLGAGGAAGAVVGYHHAVQDQGFVFSLPVSSGRKT